MSSVIQLMRQVEQLTEAGIALSAERNIDQLLNRILTIAKDLTHADGGTFYVVKEREIHFWVAVNDTLSMKMGGVSGQPVTLGPIPLHQADGRPNDNLVVVHTVFERHSVRTDDVYITEHYDFSGTVKFDEKTGYRSQSMLTIPLFNHERQVSSVIQLINAKDIHTGQVIPFTAFDQRVVECLASMASVAMTNRDLYKKQEHLFSELMNRYLEED